MLYRGGRRFGLRTVRLVALGDVDVQHRMLHHRCRRPLGDPIRLPALPKGRDTPVRLYRVRPGRCRLALAQYLMEPSTNRWLVHALCLCLIDWWVPCSGSLCAAGTARAGDPILDVSIFSRRVVAILVTTGLGWSSFGVWFYYLFQFIQQFRHVSPLDSAVQFAPGGHLREFCLPLPHPI